MSFDSLPSREDEAAKIARIGIMALQIVDNKHFKEILKQATPQLRKLVYEEIKPHLRFKPKPYWLLMA